MIRSFRPHVEIFSSEQKALWRHLRPAKDLGFVLFGGTAVALRLAHRRSEDFDFFATRPLNKEALRKAMPFLRKAVILQDEPNTLTVLAGGETHGSRQVKVSFFGDIRFAVAKGAQLTQDGVLKVASLRDLMATKVAVVLKRVMAKDYQDIAAMISSGVSLAKGLATARVFYGDTFPVSESLRALVYFEGGDLKTLSKGDKETLISAARRLERLPPL